MTETEPITQGWEMTDAFNTAELIIFTILIFLRYPRHLAGLSQTQQE